LTSGGRIPLEVPLPRSMFPCRPAPHSVRLLPSANCPRAVTLRSGGTRRLPFLIDRMPVPKGMDVPL
jgi:hypothetical protein